MTLRTRLTALLLPCFAIGLILASCSKKAEVETEAPTSQVVAKVGDQVVTIQELDNEFRLANVSSEMRKDPETIRRVLGELVTRKYLVKQALDAKLDREPTVLLDILRSRELVLANALVSRNVITKSNAISKPEIDNYIANNPVKFGDRKILSVEQISVPQTALSQTLLDDTKEMKSLDEVDQKLTSSAVPRVRSAAAICPRTCSIKSWQNSRTTFSSFAPAPTPCISRYSASKTSLWKVRPPSTRRGNI
jgi:EpsD family peptidyl-prolyl cis-trans isomerase